ncbi:hypothetical protein B0H34DRAFT_86414 [Crassisporium funariophilum]|nr:hypothetical protein B0H34DRAFT_86414 [Crassisporium funariophilum]
MYGRPLNATNDALWEKALRENPDPSCIASPLDFDDLSTRASALQTQSASHLTALTALSSTLLSLRTTHATATAPRLTRALAAHTRIMQRVMHIVAQLHLLIPGQQGGGDLGGGG